MSLCRHNFGMPRSLLLLPVAHKGGGFGWKGLRVREAEQSGIKMGLGVFATRELQQGTLIPVLGRVVEQAGTHVFCINGDQVDGHPAVAPYQKVGNRGLSIAMMVNESNQPNCVFLDSGYLQLYQNVEPGSQLFVFRRVIDVEKVAIRAKTRKLLKPTRDYWQAQLEAVETPKKPRPCLQRQLLNQGLLPSMVEYTKKGGSGEQRQAFFQYLLTNLPQCGNDEGQQILLIIQATSLFNSKKRKAVEQH